MQFMVLVHFDTILVICHLSKKLLVTPWASFLYSCVRTHLYFLQCICHSALYTSVNSISWFGIFLEQLTFAKLAKVFIESEGLLPLSQDRSLDPVLSQLVQSAPLHSLFYIHFLTFCQLCRNFPGGFFDLFC
jgi:hypothetical protein